MSEPVGNSPRNTANIPSNSHKEQPGPLPSKEDEDRAPIEKVIEGRVVTRKPPRWKRLARSIIADDAQNIGDFLLVDVIAPALRNLIADTIKGGTDRVIYGQARARRAGMDERRGSLRTRYDQMSAVGERDREPRRMMSRESKARHDFDEVVLADRAEAVEVVELMIARVVKYGSASVADLYDYVGVTGSFADQRWGWTDLTTADVRQVRTGWLLDLPQPEPLR